MRHTELRKDGEEKQRKSRATKEFKEGYLKMGDKNIRDRVSLLVDKYGNP